MGLFMMDSLKSFWNNRTQRKQDSTLMRHESLAKYLHNSHHHQIKTSPQASNHLHEHVNHPNKLLITHRNLQDKHST